MGPRVRVKTKVTDKQPMGYKRLFTELGGLGSISLGVQGEEAKEQHSNSPLTIGQVAAIHELGLSGGHRTTRSWLSTWMDRNQQRMVDEAKAAMQEVAKGRSTRRKAFDRLGYKWVVELQENIDSSGVKPPLRESTIARKGHSIPMLETGDVRNAITYRLKLPRLVGGEANAPYAAALALSPIGAGGMMIKGRKTPKRGGAVRILKIKKIGGVKMPKSRKTSDRKKKKQAGVKPPRKMKIRRTRARAPRGGSMRRSGRASRGWLKFLLKMVRKAARAFKTKSGTSYRNHGFTGVRRQQTGFKGR